AAGPPAAPAQAARAAAATRGEAAAAAREPRPAFSAAPPADILEICGGLEELAGEGLLMSDAPELEGYKPQADRVIKALCLHVAHDCNLRCRYCFAGAGAFGGDRSLMPLDTGKKALDFLFDASGSREHVEVDYFGGEPLLNFPVVKELILYGEEESRRRGKVLKQTLTTNGVLLQGDVLDFLDRHEVALVLSLDGRREVNDRMRPAVGGSGSYDVILPHFREAVDKREGGNYYLRGTYTRYNQDFFQDVRHMVEAGYDMVSVEPVVAGPDEDYAFRREDLPELYRQYEELARYYLDRARAGKPFTFFHFNLDLDRGPCLPKRLSGCGAGFEYLAVTPEGALYPCHQFAGNADFAMGDVFGGITKPVVGDRFRESHVLTKEKCRGCWARFYCSGGCHANAWNFNRDLREPYALGCELEKKRLECAIWIKAMETE
ncbi:MAG: thioether cross-link-forming SCIFF peptide maturase, partial [Clostridiales bacterium]|nr:thioether cross-link-forming SCIFF peptide maturase [Clostridiales bacterium]